MHWTLIFLPFALGCVCTGLIIYRKRIEFSAFDYVLQKGMWLCPLVWIFLLVIFFLVKTHRDSFLDE